jgi:hypothetical protein
MKGDPAMLAKGNSVLGCAIAVLTLLLAGTASTATPVLLNPGFESPDASGGDVPGTANWDTFNQVYTTATTSHSGSQCLKTFGPFQPGGGTGARQILNASFGQTWVGEIWALNWSTDPIDNVDFGVLKIEFLNSSFQFVAGGLVGVDIFESNPISGATPRDVWTKLGVGTAPAPPNTRYARIVLVKVDVDGAQGGSIFWDDAIVFWPADVAPGEGARSSLDLQPNAPNPFSGATRIGFILSEPDDIVISVHDAAGRLVRVLLQSRIEAGSHFVEWNGKLASGVEAPSGVYRYLMRSPNGRISRSMNLIR